eukprot:m.181345 g.181345  ORF g.181345 m.181345 type:complete len:540 (+) comp14963_c0_seq2:2063-3682(+)
MTIVDENELLLETEGQEVVPKPQRTWGREGVSLLKWSCLAACTIGPGTVVVCAKAGADFKLHLIWTVVLASFVAFVLQKEAGRLTIESKMSLGTAIRRHFGRGSRPRHTAVATKDAGQGDPTTESFPGISVEKVPVAGYAAVIGVFVGNAAYEANCFVGAMAALYVLYTNVEWFRVLMAVATGVATLGAVLWGNVDQIGAALGGIVVAMTVVFAVTAGYAAVDPADFGWGLLPNFPSGSSITVLSLMATTCIPFNVFLAASLCGDTTPGEMRRGIAFASTITAVISVLLIIIGSDIDIPVDQDFAVEDLGNQIGAKLGIEAKVLFCVGLYAAAYSSAITCPLGAALTAEQILADDREATEADEVSASLEAPGVSGGRPTAMRYRMVPLLWLEKWRNGGLFFKLSMVVAIGTAVGVAAGNVDTVSVILLAQVINGLLLPFLATSLFVCLNDPAVMPQRMRARDNGVILVCVAVTIFLAAHLVLEQVSILAAGGAGSEDVSEGTHAAWSAELNIYLAVGVSVVAAAGLLLRTHLANRTFDG